MCSSDLSECRDQVVLEGDGRPWYVGSVISGIKPWVHFRLTQITCVALCIVDFTAVHTVYVYGFLYVAVCHNPTQSPAYIKYFMIIFFYQLVSWGEALNDTLSFLLSAGLY